MKKIIYTGCMVAVLAAAGCATKTGYEPRVSLNAADNSRAVSIVPHAACLGAAQGCALSVGASWSSKTPDEATLNIALASAVTIKELRLDIDGEKVVLKADGAAKSELAGGMRPQKQSFKTKIGVVKYIVESKNTSMKAVTADGVAIDAPIIEDGKDTYAFNALKRFLQKVKYGSV